MIKAWLIVLVLAFAASGCGGGTTYVAPPSGPPISPGTTWTYKHTVVTASGVTLVGTLTNVYRGQAAYRGGTYYLAESTDTLQPGYVFRDYLVWTNNIFREYAATATDPMNNLLEIIFDKTIALTGVQESLSGTDQIFLNGVSQGSGLWSISVSNQGTVTITVPAGTFSTVKWNGDLVLGSLRQIYSAYTTGLSLVQRNANVYAAGTFLDADTQELTSGPAPTAMSFAAASTGLGRIGTTLPTLQERLRDLIPAP